MGRIVRVQRRLLEGNCPRGESAGANCLRGNFMGVVLVVREQFFESNFPSAESPEGNWIVLEDYLMDGKCSGADIQGELSLNPSESSTHSWATLYLINIYLCFPDINLYVPQKHVWISEEYSSHWKERLCFRIMFPGKFAPCCWFDVHGLKQVVLALEKNQWNRYENLHFDSIVLLADYCALKDRRNH